MTSSATIGVGIVGTGRMAATMAAALVRQSSFRLSAVCSGSADRSHAFARRFSIPQRFDDLRAFCQAPHVDLVYIANATRDHVTSSLVAIGAGKSVLCEKPFALRGAEGQQVVEAAQAGGVFFMEALWTLFLPAYRRLDTLVRGGSFGCPKHLRFDFGYPAHETDRDRLFSAIDGGILFDRGCYGVALAIQTLGPAARVWLGSQTGGDALQLKHDCGALSQIAVSGVGLLSNAVTVGCSAGAVGLDPPSLGAESLWSIPYSPAPLTEVTGTDLRRRLQRLPGLRRLHARLTRPRREWHSYGAGHYDPMLAQVAAHLRAGATISEIAPPSLSLAILDVLERGMASGAARP